MEKNIRTAKYLEIKEKVFALKKKKNENNF